MHVPHSGSTAGSGLGVGTLPQYSNITCLTTAVGNGNLNGAGGGSQTPPMAHSTLGMSAPAPGSPGAALQSDYAPTASLVAAAGYSYATSGSGFENGKCASSLGVRVNQRLSRRKGVRGGSSSDYRLHSNTCCSRLDLCLRGFIAVGVGVAALCEF